MSSGVTLRWDTRAGHKLIAGVHKGLLRAGFAYQGAVKRRFTTASNIVNGGEASGGSTLSVGTGTLRRSIRVNENENVGLRPKVVVKAGGRSSAGNVPYAAIHEFGGVILPRNVKYLPVPLPWAQQRAKQIRRKAGATLRNARNLTLIKSKRGNLLLAEMTGKGKGRRMSPVFILKKSVRMTARPYMRPSLVESRPKMLSNIKSEIRKAIRTIEPGDLLQ